MKQIGFRERNFRKKWINLSSSSSFSSSSQISLEVFELAKMRLATHARTLKVHVTPYKDRKVSIGYDYSLYSRFVCSLSDVSRGFLTHGRPKSTPPRKCDDERERKRAKKRRKKCARNSRGLCATRTMHARTSTVRGRGRNRRAD